MKKKNGLGEEMFENENKLKSTLAIAFFYSQFGQGRSVAGGGRQYPLKQSHSPSPRKMEMGSVLPPLILICHL